MLDKKSRKTLKKLYLTSQFLLLPHRLNEPFVTDHVKRFKWFWMSLFSVKVLLIFPRTLRQVPAVIHTVKVTQLCTALGLFEEIENHSYSPMQSF